MVVRPLPMVSESSQQSSKARYGMVVTPSGITTDCSDVMPAKFLLITVVVSANSSRVNGAPLMERLWE